MKNLSYHGKTVEQAQWVLDYFGTDEMREFYKNHQSYNDWLDACRQVVEARRLDY
jgi:hypothetical protein